MVTAARSWAADMSTNVTELIKQGDLLFSKRGSLLDFWQSLYEQFNPIDADFTTTRQLGTDYAAGLMTSYPLIVARDLTDQFSTMLRPSDKEWATMEVDGLQDHDAKKWLEWATKAQRRAMYDRAAQFVVATKAGDRDFGLAGQCVISVDMMPDRSALLYRNWHLRDVAWSDGVNGSVECVHRKWDTPTAWELSRIFGVKKLHPKVVEQLGPGRDPYCVVKCRHIVIPTDLYHGETKFRTPLVSIYIDVENEHIIEVTGQRINPYVIPRWQRIKGTQYAASPAAICALPEARLLQAMTFTLLEAGEKFTNPPLLGVREAIRGDVDLAAGGITYVSAEYDERMGEVLRPLTQDKSGMPLGLELMQRSEEMLKKAFYADKLQMPVRGPEMTAYEVGQRVQQYIRDALPLFEPVEVDYNGALCERTFDVMALNGGFGPPDSWPKALRSEQIEFKFVSPLRDAIEKQKGEIFMQGVQLVSTAVSLDPSSATVVEASEALRDALEGIGFEAKWMRSREDAQAINASEAQQAQAQQTLEAMGQASAVVKNMGGAAAMPVAA
jgi:hypothetical protein